MASTFTGMTSVGSLAAPGSRVMDDKIAASNRLSSLASISSSSLGRRKNIVLRKSRSSQITAAAKDLYFNKDGSAIKKLQVSTATFGFCYIAKFWLLMGNSLVVRLVLTNLQI